MTPIDLARRRLYSQHIVATRCHTPGEVVAALGAVQAQDYPASKWAIGLRLPQATDADIEQAIADRAIVRTWPMRGTLHFVAAADVRWLLALLAPRVIGATAGRHRQLELTADDLARSRDVFETALSGGRQLTRDAMYQTLEAAGITTAGQRGIHILGHLARQGVLCFGPHQGKQPTFVLLDEWLPPSPPVAREEALARLAFRYFSGHGPATLQDLMWWAGLTAADARTAITLAAPQLAQAAVGGQTYWQSPSARAADGPIEGIQLLPAYDEFLLGYRDRSASLAPAHADAVAPGANGVFRPILVVDGRVMGTWSRTVKRGAVTVTPQPFPGQPSNDRDALTAAAARYAHFLGGTPGL